MIKNFIKKVVEGNSLTLAESQTAMNQIMDGGATDAQISALIVALRMKGETVDEITGLAKVMQENASRINVSDPRAIDTCGTGGDGKHTLNVSTLAAIVAVGAGAVVAKHGNRSVSSSCGSADLLAALGVEIELDPIQIEQCIQETGIGFLFAPLLHRAMKHAVKPRKEIALRTVFNILGPLTNPARVKRQIIGVFDLALTETMAAVLRGLGSEKAFVVHGMDGLDEISISAETTVSELSDGEISNYFVTPEEFGIKRHPITEIVGGNIAKNRKIALDVLDNVQSASRDIVILNAGFAIAASSSGLTIQEAVKAAEISLSSGSAKNKLKELVQFTKKAAQ